MLFPLSLSPMGGARRVLAVDGEVSRRAKLGFDWGFGACVRS